MAKTTAWVLGAVYVIAGVWGLFGSSPLGFMAYDMTSSIVHIVVGIVLLALASKPQVGMALKVVGILYVVFAVAGFVQGNTVLGLFKVDNLTTWVYLVLGLVGAGLGFAAKGSSETPSNPVSPAPQV